MIEVASPLPSRDISLKTVEQALDDIAEAGTEVFNKY